MIMMLFFLLNAAVDADVSSRLSFQESCDRFCAYGHRELDYVGGEFDEKFNEYIQEAKKCVEQASEFLSQIPNQTDKENLSNKLLELTKRLAMVRKKYNLKDPDETKKKPYMAHIQIINPQLATYTPIPSSANDDSSSGKLLRSSTPTTPTGSIQSGQSTPPST